MTQTDPLSVEYNADHTEVHVRYPCSVRWSTDTCTWHDMGSFDVGHTIVDPDGTPAKPRSYMSIDADGHVQIYYHQAAALSFADMMEPWFPTRVNPEFAVQFDTPHPVHGNPVGPFSSERAAKRWAKTNAPDGVTWKVLEDRWK